MAIMMCGHCDARSNRKNRKRNKMNSNWLSTNFPAAMIDTMPVRIKHKSIGEIKGHLTVEKDDKKGGMIVSANYDSNPFHGAVSATKFYLTQDQLNAFTGRGAVFVLIAP
jgi:hypothetical protein